MFNKEIFTETLKEVWSFKLVKVGVVVDIIMFIAGFVMLSMGR